MVSKSRPRREVQAFDSTAERGPAALALSGRDLAVLRLVVEGFADKEIAHEIGVSVFTINKSIQSILRYTDATSRTLAAVRAIKLGLVD
jgi:DNA-binding NarL/FixJ family response regulator